MSDHERNLLAEIEAKAAPMHRRTSRRKRLMRKVMMGGMVVLSGTGAHQAGLLDLSPSHTTQLAMVKPAGPVEDADSVLLTPAEADAEARAVPSIVDQAADFDPDDYAALTGSVLQTGEASYYGNEFAGRPTANGEIFNPEALTAAHKTLPLGSIIRVTNTQTGDSLVLRVNDRGPYAHGRVLDVSEAAARELNMKHAGTAEVRIEVL